MCPCLFCVERKYVDRKTAHDIHMYGLLCDARRGLAPALFLSHDGCMKALHVMPCGRFRRNNKCGVI